MVQAPFVLIVGNSGSGKDSLIREAVRRWPAGLPSLVAPKRYITRPPHPSEPFHSITRDQFDRMRQQNSFCLNWTSYGLEYGVPVDVLEDQQRGHPVMANVSRNIVDHARENLPGIHVAYVHVPLEVTIERINRRGREKSTSPMFQERIDRARNNPLINAADTIIDNSGCLENAARDLCLYIKSHLNRAAGGAL
jgi:ribose 1,5-bisphosphokinase